MVWDKYNGTPYHLRGWCVSEYSIARHYDRIVNSDDDLVRLVDSKHQWPKTFEDYENILVPKGPVDFTSKGDVNAVKSVFFRFTQSLLGDGIA